MSRKLRGIGRTACLLAAVVAVSLLVSAAVGVGTRLTRGRWAFQAEIDNLANGYPARKGADSPGSRAMPCKKSSDCPGSMQCPEEGGSCEVCKPMTPARLAAATWRYYVKPDHIYYNLPLLFRVDIRGGKVVAHTCMKDVYWKQRAYEVLKDLKTVSGLPDATVPIYLHDGCHSLHGLYLAFGVTPTSCHCGIPIPMSPACHNPLWPERRKTFVAPDPTDDRVVWRGSSTNKRPNNPRSIIVELAKNHSIIDARMIPPKSNMIPFEKFFEYRYIADLDGAGSSFRLSSLLMGKSIVLRPESYDYWFSNYTRGKWLPIKPDLSDLVETVQRLNRDPPQDVPDIADLFLRDEYRHSLWRETLKRFPPMDPLAPCKAGLNLGECMYEDGQCSCQASEIANRDRSFALRYQQPRPSRCRMRPRSRCRRL